MADDDKKADKSFEGKSDTKTADAGGAPEPSTQDNPPATRGSGGLQSNTPGSVTSGGEQLSEANPEGGTAQYLQSGAVDPNTGEAVDGPLYEDPGELPGGGPSGVYKLHSILKHIQRTDEDSRVLFGIQGGNIVFTVGDLRSVFADNGSAKKSKK